MVSRGFWCAHVVVSDLSSDQDHDMTNEMAAFRRLVSHGAECTPVVVSVPSFGQINRMANEITALGHYDLAGSSVLIRWYLLLRWIELIVWPVRWQLSNMSISRGWIFAHSGDIDCRLSKASPCQ
jgi:hypothetical protein